MKHLFKKALSICLVFLIAFTIIPLTQIKSSAASTLTEADANFDLSNIIDIEATAENGIFFDEEKNIIYGFLPQFYFDSKSLNEQTQREYLYDNIITTDEKLPPSAYVRFSPAKHSKTLIATGSSVLVAPKSLLTHTVDVNNTGCKLFNIVIFGDFAACGFVGGNAILKNFDLITNGQSAETESLKSEFVVPALAYGMDTNRDGFVDKKDRAMIETASKLYETAETLYENNADEVLYLSAATDYQYSIPQGKRVYKSMKMQSQQTSVPQAMLGTDLQTILQQNLVSFEVSYYEGFDINNIKKDTIFIHDKLLKYSEFNPDALGTQKITVTYDNQISTTINVDIITTIFNAFDRDKSEVNLDSGKMIFSNLNPGINTLDKMFNLNPSYEISWDAYGTGRTIVFLYNGKEFDSAKMLIYGDTNGDGWYDKADINEVQHIINNKLSLKDYKSNTCVYMAADVNRDNKVDQNDIDLLNKADELLKKVNKNNPSETQEAYNDYCNLIEQDIVKNNEDNDNTSIWDKIVDLFKKILRFFGFNI